MAEPSEPGPFWQSICDSNFSLTWHPCVSVSVIPSVHTFGDAVARPSVNRGLGKKQGFRQPNIGSIYTAAGDSPLPDTINSWRLSVQRPGPVRPRKHASPEK
ncbi:hypothetical protein C8034_v008750 [Colletotrichum sidae]|uniref:Uncharacterized protein n=1 Tax=Colletotrichum sidae TaxID=1347389 RepID=A0A4R8TP62_9PEZI|nr:hypothetical protein C8034_v008750 [Colletotrichum sidae]